MSDVFTKHRFELRYDNIVIGLIDDAYEGDRTTWWGNFHAAKNVDKDARHCRVESYIALCRDWDRRDEAGEEPSADEFNVFDDLIHSELWSVCESDGQLMSIESPFFFSFDPPDNISWRTPEDS